MAAHGRFSKQELTADVGVARRPHRLPAAGRRLARRLGRHVRLGGDRQPVVLAGHARMLCWSKTGSL
jgi:hypothetical protein